MPSKVQEARKDQVILTKVATGKTVDYCTSFAIDGTITYRSHMISACRVERQRDTRALTQSSCLFQPLLSIRKLTSSFCLMKKACPLPDVLRKRDAI